MIIRRDIEQRTDEWMEVKRGKLSGTSVKTIYKVPQLQNPLPKGKLRDLAPWRTLIYDLIGQDEYRYPMTYNQELYLSKAVQWGQDNEPFAINAFQKKYKKIIEDIGWIESTDKRFAKKLGMSPDGLITVKEMVEIKCLNTANHIKCIVNDEYPPEYHPQVVNYFVVNGKLQKLYFIMYDPRMKSEDKRLFVKEVTRRELREDIKNAKINLTHFFQLKKAVEKELYK